jgi:hypothetical protein
MSPLHGCPIGPVVPMPLPPGSKRIALVRVANNGVAIEPHTIGRPHLAQGLVC